MKVLLLTPPYHCGVVESAGRWVPLPLVYLAGSARAAGHEVVIYDAMTLWHDQEQIAERLEREQPDFIGITAITATYPVSVEVLAAAKKANPSVVTGLGGVHGHFMFREVLAEHHDAVDIVFRGEGEESLVEVLAALPDRAALADVRGIAFWHEGEAVVTPPRPKIRDLDALPLAHDLLDWDLYELFVIEDSVLGAISTSRGCPFGCTFCSQQLFWNRSWRARSPESVLAELRDLKQRFGVNVVLLSDEYPTADGKRWEKLLDLLIEADLGIYLLMETRVEDILRDEQHLWKYRKAGIIHIYMGIEATDQATLDRIKKDIKVEQSHRALQLVSSHGMVTETSLVLGFPDESPEHIEQTLLLAQHFNPDNAHFLAITPWPYSNLYTEVKDHIVVHDYGKYNLIEPIIKPVNMTLDELDQAMIDCYRRFYAAKMKDFLDEPDPFRRHYLVEAARLIMGSSFITEKMGKGVGMPQEVKDMVARLKG